MQTAVFRGERHTMFASLAGGELGESANAAAAAKLGGRVRFLGPRR